MAPPAAHGHAGSGSVIFESSELSLARAKELAADLFEASTQNIVVSESAGSWWTACPAGSSGWVELAPRPTSAAHRSTSSTTRSSLARAFRSAPSVAVVEVDVDTGKVAPIRHLAVEIGAGSSTRCSSPANCTAGISQALWDEVRYDDGNR